MELVLLKVTSQPGWVQKRTDRSTRAAWDRVTLGEGILASLGYSRPHTQSLSATTQPSQVPLRFLVPCYNVPRLPALLYHQNQSALSAAPIRQSTLQTAQP